MTASTHRTDARRTNTRQQIQSVALALFAEQGYERTSLREIAERLGITKAAVYYHFRTKEEILSSLLDGQVADLGKIIDWAERQPPGPERNREIIERYSALLGDSESHHMVKLIQESEISLRDLGAGTDMITRLRQLSELLVVPGGSLADQIRARVALVTLHFGFFQTSDLSNDEQARRAAALEVALDLAVR